MKRLIFISIATLIGASGLAYAAPPSQPLKATRAGTSVEAQVQEAPVPVSDQTQVDQAAPAPDSQSSTSAPATSDVTPQAEVAPVPAAPEAPKHELMQCTILTEDSGEVGNKERYKYYRVCTYTDGNDTRDYVGSSSTPNLMFEG